MLAYTIVLLGAGRVGQHLGPALAAAGHHVMHVWSRTLAAAQRVAASIPGATADTELAALPPADLYLVAVPDGAVPELLAAAHLPAGALVVHTAGALDLAVFAARPEVRGGVLYPLQTFSPGRHINWKTVPLCLEVAHATDAVLLGNIAASLSQDVRWVDSGQRLQLHVAAVWACNFPNHLLGISHALLTEAGLPWELLRPLIEETMAKALTQPPFSVQTGPAIRHDQATLARHEAAQGGHPEWQALYKHLTGSIQQVATGAAANNEAGLQL
ncbi:Rossmann-like and DUF2520 domain-containing protein [Hymenobacter glacieicola]|uniref:DUF2520 domain-containing protein n=1 Tax=Hymenobacter glacieicola TaxID=1562124 RepID=A0ABQ1X668_9BACT|nr:Rossmann-like and DUF2520 domain-containing protein [Hymenobacter glacieicola]GGG57850.1 hypothetical protein GCM10011378_37390 [Hymenobacter glacieicola]